MSNVRLASRPGAPTRTRPAQSRSHRRPVDRDDGDPPRTPARRSRLRLHRLSGIGSTNRTRSFDAVGVPRVARERGFSSDGRGGAIRRVRSRRVRQPRIREVIRADGCPLLARPHARLRRAHPDASSWIVRRFVAVCSWAWSWPGGNRVGAGNRDGLQSCSSSCALLGRESWRRQRDRSRGWRPTGCLPIDGARRTGREQLARLCDRWRASFRRVGAFGVERSSREVAGSAVEFGLGRGPCESAVSSICTLGRGRLSARQGSDRRSRRTESRHARAHAHVGQQPSIDPVRDRPRRSRGVGSSELRVDPRLEGPPGHPQIFSRGWTRQPPMTRPSLPMGADSSPQMM